MPLKVQILRSLVEQRLSAAAEEIFVLFERTIAEYEEELCRSQEEKHRRRRQTVETVLFHSAVDSIDSHQQPGLKEEVPPEQKEWSPSVEQDQGDSEDHLIKEEQEELWTYQEADINKIPPTSVPEKSRDEEKAQCLQLHQRQTEKNQPEAHTEGAEGPGPAGSLDPQRHSPPVGDDHSLDWLETEETDWTETHMPQCGSGSVRRVEPSQTDTGLRTEARPLCCSYCGKRFTHKGSLNIHMRYHTGEKPFSCSVCSKSFHVRDHLNRHMKCHTGEKPFKCHFCGKCVAEKGDLTRHIRVHTGDKPYSCSVCGKSFTVSGHLKRHMRSTHSHLQPSSEHTHTVRAFTAAGLSVANNYRT